MLRKDEVIEPHLRLERSFELKQVGCLVVLGFKEVLGFLEKEFRFFNIGA